MLWIVVWVVLMILWLFGVGYLNYDPNNPRAVGGVIIPWLCVAILGVFLFGGFNVPPGALR